VFNEFDWIELPFKVKAFALGSKKIGDFIVIEDDSNKSKIYHCRL